MIAPVKNWSPRVISPRISFLKSCPSETIVPLCCENPDTATISGSLLTLNKSIILSAFNINLPSSMKASLILGINPSFTGIIAPPPIPAALIILPGNLSAPVSEGLNIAAPVEVPERVGIISSFFVESCPAIVLLKVCALAVSVALSCAAILTVSIASCFSASALAASCAATLTVGAEEPPPPPPLERPEL